jgi:hypothetical protein
MLTIQNRGQAIAHTNYWDSDHARRGYLYLTWNAGAARLLIPDVAKPLLHDMKNAQEVIVSRGPWTAHDHRDALELLWEDHTDTPFAIHLVAEQTDRLLPETDQGSGFVVTAWTRGGCKARWPGRYRVVDAIPCLQPWTTN